MRAKAAAPRRAFTVCDICGDVIHEACIHNHRRQHAESMLCAGLQARQQRRERLGEVAKRIELAGEEDAMSRFWTDRPKLTPEKIEDLKRLFGLRQTRANVEQGLSSDEEGLARCVPWLLRQASSDHEHRETLLAGTTISYWRHAWAKDRALGHAPTHP